MEFDVFIILFIAGMLCIIFYKRDYRHGKNSSETKAPVPQEPEWKTLYKIEFDNDKVKR